MRPANSDEPDQVQYAQKVTETVRSTIVDRPVVQKTYYDRKASKPDIKPGTKCFKKVKTLTGAGRKLKPRFDKLYRVRFVYLTHATIVPDGEPDQKPAEICRALVDASGKSAARIG